MQSFFHTIATAAISLYLSAVSFLGWNTPPKELVDSPLPSQALSSTSPAFRKEATSTVVTNKPTPLPYLKIVAPEFKFIPINRPIAILPTPSSTPTPAFPTPTIAISPTSVPVSSPESSIVNVYCTVRNGNTVTAITGSGVLVSSKGVVLTNSHVAQYVLLADYLNENNRSCEVRTGAIAQSSYSVHVLYISPEWVKNNANNLKDINPSGTGEFDYAFLEIESGAKNLPGKTDYLELSTENTPTGDSVSIIAYPAGHLDGLAVMKNLHRSEDSSTISNTYSFGYTNNDLLIAQTDALAQKGSSGGAVIGTSGRLDGIISTSIPNQQTGHTSLAALSTLYIEKDYFNHTGQTVSGLLLENPHEKYSLFENSVGFNLAKILLSN
jgi:S1-C subfamily serine protease